MNVAGIDPGLTGALAIIDEYRVVFVDDLPVHQIHAGKRTRAELDLGGMRELLTSLTYDHVFIEQVAARPGQGVTSMFRFGLTAGQIVGLVAGLRVPYSLVLPQRGQRIASCGPAPDEARRRAGLRWTHPVGQFGGLDKLGSGYRQAANFSAAGAQYASSGVPPASMECGRLAL